MNYLQKKKLAFMSIVNRVKGFIRTVTGALPLTLEGCVDEESIIDYTLYGQSVQNGTPTPDTPIEVESVGEKTVNLFDISSVNKMYNIRGDDISNYLIIEDGVLRNKYGIYADKIYIPCNITTLSAGTYTLSCEVSGATTGYIGVYINKVGRRTTFKNPNGVDWGKISYKFTLEEESTITGIQLQGFGDASNYLQLEIYFRNIQIEESDTAKDYEPYGYKIPIKVSGNHEPITTNIYLDEPLRKVPNSDRLYYENQICARRVKEYICKGNEGWHKNGEKDGLVRYSLGGIIPVGTVGRRSILTNMYPQTNNHSFDWWQLNTVQAWGFTTQTGWIGVCVSIEDFPTVTDFKNFVATKYSEGNPLKMYFGISATETPITLPPIPTFKGTSIISADTTIQPSNVEIEYYSNVKE